MNASNGQRHSPKPDVKENWQGLSDEAFYGTFCDKLEDTHHETKPRSYSKSDIPICCVCDKINLGCSPLPACHHPACEKCLTVTTADSARKPACRVCAASMETREEKDKQEDDSNSDDDLKARPHVKTPPNGGESTPAKGDSPTKKPASHAESIKRIQEALKAATKYTQCSTCLQDKKWQSPDLLCLDCGLSFCNRCSGKHKAVPANSIHIMVSVEGRKSAKVIEKVHCPVHTDKDLDLFCMNCEQVMCALCSTSKHKDCPGKASMKEHVDQERDELKLFHNKHSQVMKFFSEQRRGLEEATAALYAKKKEYQSQVRKFFSVLIKTCMNVEGALLEELEMAVSDHTDLLQENSNSWLLLQEDTQQLLDLADNLHCLPAVDLLPLASATKTTLSKLLREGETLAASVPPHMTLSLHLEQSSQRSVVKRIREIGTTALTVNTHKVLTLRLITSASLSAPKDKTEPLVTSITQLADNILLVGDFNNSSLKLLVREHDADEWQVAEVLALKSRPYNIAQLSGIQTAPVSKANALSKDLVTSPEPGQADTQMDSSPHDSQRKSMDSWQDGSSGSGRRKVLMGRQSAVTMEDHELAIVNDENTYVQTTEVRTELSEAQVAVSSPDGHCMIVAVSVSGFAAEMRVLKTLTVEKGCWGLAALDQHTLAASSVGSGCSFVTVMDTEGTFQRNLRLMSDTHTPPLISPRHVTAVNSTNLIVSDHGKKALVGVSTDGKVQFTFTGQGNQRLCRPEGTCLDNQGRVFLADSEDNSIVVMNKGGWMHSKTASQQAGLLCPQAVCLDRNSVLYVTNEGGKTLAVFDIVEEGTQ